MRLDKYLAESGLFSRSEAGRAVRGGRITVAGEVVKNPSVHIAEDAEVCCDGKRVYWTKYQYIMLNKPAGVVSATEDGGRTVMDLLPPACKRLDMFPCGRLDIDTTGLLLITNDGPGAHMWLSPKRHVTKTYRFTCDPALHEEAVEKLESGVGLGDFTSAPAKVNLYPDSLSGEISITEGKFHQIKRMFHGVGSEITSLERITFGPLVLDPALERGQWRYLTEEEIASLRALL
ncbi:MAG: rRNA pseudouridine synthase [Ruminococcaceae bacterium]|nr:rRNA pseudouridine synthase [Oscillospiraceae bacterium]